MSRNRIVYLAGKTNGDKYKVKDKIRTLSANSTRTEFTASDSKSHSEHGWGMAAFQFKHWGLRRLVKDYFLNELENCEMLFAYLDYPTAYGSIAEIATASAQGKFCYVATLYDEKICNSKPHEHRDEEKIFNDRMFDAYWFVANLPNVACNPIAETGERAIEKAAEWFSAILDMESPIEHKFFQAISEQTDTVIIPQFPAGKYRLDFGLPIESIAIEINGHEYHKTKEQRGYDAQRDRFLNSEGWRVYRFTGSEVYRDAEKCAKEILQAIKTARAEV